VKRNIQVLFHVSVELAAKTATIVTTEAVPGDPRRSMTRDSRARHVAIAKAFAWASSFRKRNNFDQPIRSSSAAASAARSFRDDDSNNTIHPVDIY